MFQYGPCLTAAMNQDVHTGSCIYKVSPGSSNRSKYVLGVVVTYLGAVRLYALPRVSGFNDRIGSTDKITQGYGVSGR